MATSRTPRDARYNAKSSRYYHFKFNVRTDADIIAELDRQPGIQAYIKRLIQEDIAREAQHGNGEI